MTSTATANPETPRGLWRKFTQSFRNPNITAHLDDEIGAILPGELLDTLEFTGRSREEIESLAMTTWQQWEESRKKVFPALGVSTHALYDTAQGTIKLYPLHDAFMEAAAA